MNSDFTFIVFSLPLWILLTASFLFAFVITYFSIPTIVIISRYKKLFDIPNQRTSHNNEIPVLGGLAIFAGFTLASAICSLPVDSTDVKFILGGTIVIFFLGLKDDIMIVDPKKKLLIQIVAASLIVVLGDIRITNLHSFLGFESISYIPSVIFTVFLFLTLINGFNLIDGVDGLASGTGIVVSLALSIWFILTCHYTYAVLCLSLAGTLTAYFRFNVFGKQNKIFMGDTGSMITGLVIAVLIVQFLEFEVDASPDYQFDSTPAIAFSLLILPLFDTLRVFILRIKDGRSPFKAEKNHIHHLLLELGFSHLKVTVCLVLINIFFLFLVYLFQFAGNILLILFIMLLATLLSVLLSLRVKQQRQKNSKQY